MGDAGLGETTREAAGEWLGITSVSLHAGRWEAPGHTVTITMVSRRLLVEISKIMAGAIRLLLRYGHIGYCCKYSAVFASCQNRSFTHSAGNNTRRRLRYGLRSTTLKDGKH